MPLRRKYNLIVRDAYERSAATRLGLLLGRPRPCLLTAPPSINCSNTGASWRSPGVSMNVKGLPLPSHRMWILVENPPRLRPNASFCGSPLLPRLHADEHVSRSYLQSGSPTLSDHWHQHLVVPQPLFSPTHPGGSSDRSEWLLSATDRIVQVDLSKEHQFCLSRACH